MMNTEQLTELIRKAVQEVTAGYRRYLLPLIPARCPTSPKWTCGPSWLYLTRPTPRSIST